MHGARVPYQAMKMLWLALVDPPEQGKEDLQSRSIGKFRLAVGPEGCAGQN